MSPDSFLHGTHKSSRCSMVRLGSLCPWVWEDRKRCRRKGTSSIFLQRRRTWGGVLPLFCWLTRFETIPILPLRYCSPQRVPTMRMDLNNLTKTNDHPSEEREAYPSESTEHMLSLAHTLENDTHGLEYWGAPRTSFFLSCIPSSVLFCAPSVPLSSKIYALLPGLCPSVVDQFSHMLSPLLPAFAEISFLRTSLLPWQS